MKRYVKRKWWERSIGKEYKAWLADSDERQASSVDNAVPISVIVPVFNPPRKFLEECLASVITQTAINWQLIVSDDGSTAPDVVRFLDDFTEIHASDERVAVIRSENGGISAAQNRALDHVDNAYFGWLDHDDQLNPRAIELMSEAIDDAETQPLVVYSDEDKIDVRGDHFELYCKPDFSPELLPTQMYLCHFTVFETAIVKQMGGFRSEMDGAQDFDLALRLLPQLTQRNVIHIPHPLYHWRSWSESTASSIEAKPWAQEAAARAQQEHLDRTTGGSVSQSRIPGLNELHAAVLGDPLVSVIIPTIGSEDPKRGRRLVDSAVESLRRLETKARIEFIIVTTGEIAPVEGSDQQVVYQPDDGFNFAGAINLGRQHASGEYLFLMNDDVEAIERDPLSRMLELGQLQGVGAVGAKLTYPDGRLQHAGIVMLPSGPTHVNIAKPGDFPGYFGSMLTPRNYSAVTAAAMLTSSQVFDAVGGFDTSFARDFNDVDYCLRLGTVGYRVAWTPHAHLTHFEGASIVRKVADPRERAMFTERWKTAFKPDPFYSPALNQNLERIYEAR
jgi:GT2 family glycosyltransferase